MYIMCNLCVFIILIQLLFSIFQWIHCYWIIPGQLFWNFSRNWKLVHLIYNWTSDAKVSCRQEQTAIIASQLKPSAVIDQILFVYLPWVIVSVFTLCWIHLLCGFAAFLPQSCEQMCLCIWLCGYCNSKTTDSNKQDLTGNSLFAARLMPSGKFC